LVIAAHSWATSDLLAQERRESDGNKCRDAGHDGRGAAAGWLRSGPWQRWCRRIRGAVHRET